MQVTDPEPRARGPTAAGSGSTSPSPACAAKAKTGNAVHAMPSSTQYGVLSTNARFSPLFCTSTEYSVVHHNRRPLILVSIIFLGPLRRSATEDLRKARTSELPGRSKSLLDLFVFKSGHIQCIKFLQNSCVLIGFSLETLLHHSMASVESSECDIVATLSPRPGNHARVWLHIHDVAFVHLTVSERSSSSSRT